MRIPPSVTRTADQRRARRGKSRTSPPSLVPLPARATGVDVRKASPYHCGLCTRRAVSSAVEHCLHTAGVSGSIPLPPTTPGGSYRRARSWAGSSAGRASRSQCEGREFDPPPVHHFQSPTLLGWAFSHLCFPHTVRGFCRFCVCHRPYRAGQKAPTDPPSLTLFWSLFSKNRQELRQPSTRTNPLVTSSCH